MSNGRTASAIAQAQRTARAGPSNVARKPQRFHFATAVTCEFTPYCGVTHIKQFMPTFIADLLRTIGRADNISEQNGREHSIALSFRDESSQKLLNAIAKLCMKKEEMILPRQFDHSCSGDPICNEISTFDANERVILRVNNESSHADR